MTEREKIIRESYRLQRCWEEEENQDWEIRKRVACKGTVEVPGWYDMTREEALKAMEDCYLAVLTRNCLGRDFISDDYIFKALRLGWIFGKFSFQSWVTMGTLKRIADIKRKMVKDTREAIESVFDPHLCGYAMACRAWDSDLLGHDGELLAIVHREALDRLEALGYLGIETTAVCDNIHKWLLVPLAGAMERYK